jgi:hypothetical protein
MEKGGAFLSEPGITFGNDFGYEYKNWQPLWIPFIQASTGIWEADDDGLLPYNVIVPPGPARTFQIIFPNDHPFLLMDIKVGATRWNAVDVGINFSRFISPFPTPALPTFPTPAAGTPPTTRYLWGKYLYPDNEDISASLIAVSPAGRPVFGGFVNTTGFTNNIVTVGQEPHLERIPLHTGQSAHSGRGSLRNYYLFPKDGIARVEVENSATGDSEYRINGMAFGYVMMR